MFNKLALLAFVAPLVAGLTLQIPTNPTSGGSVTIKWTSAPGDPPTFSIELTNESFNNAFAIANTVTPEDGEITLTLPIVPVGAGYTLQAVAIGNINQVFAETGEFNVGANAATSVSSLSSSSTSGSSTSSRASSTSTTPATTRPTTSTSSFGTTVTTPTGSTTGTGSQTGTTSGTSSGAPSTTGNAAASSHKMSINMGAFAAVLFSAVAGAAAIAL